jgi:hypothetical protein
MGRETENLLNKRFNYRIFGWLLIFVAVAGLFVPFFLAFQIIASRLRRPSFDSAPVNNFQLFSMPLIENGAPAPMLFVLAVVFLLIGAVGIRYLKKASNITKRLKARDDEVSQRILVEESLSKRDRERRR